MSDTDAVLQRRIEREHQARLEAEALLERKSLELYAANQELLALARDLEDRVRLRTEELSEATRLRELAIQSQLDSERQYRDLVESANDIIFRTDAKGRFTYVNARMVEATGHPAEKLIGMQYLDLVAPDYRDGVQAVLAQQHVQRAPQSYLEFPALTASGSTFWVGQSVTLLLYGGHIAGFQAVARDVTARVLLEVKQRAQYEIGLILGGSDNDIPRVARRVLQIICDRTEWAYGEVWLHDATTTTLTYSASWSHDLPPLRTFEAEARSRQFRDGQGLPGLVASSNDVVWLPLLSEATTFQRIVQAGQAGLQSALGFPITISGEVTAVVCLFSYERRSYDGDMVRLAASIGNHMGQYIERCRAEEQLASARDAALESSRLKSEFLATMSHEIRTPMNAVIGTAELLSLTPLDDDQRELTGTIQTSANALLRIIDDILDFSKIEAGKMTIENTEFDLVEMVHSALELLAANTRERSLSLNIEIDAGVRGLRLGDPNRIRQVLLNLVGNAVKFTETGGVIVRILSGEDHDIRFEVEDSGIGLSETARKRLFEPFTQADGSVTRKYGGTGLGLSISRRLVEVMGGRLGLESEEATGSTFWFILPLPLAGDAVPVPAVPPVALAAAAPRSNSSILVAEDNPTNQKVIARQLAVLGYSHELAVNGIQALAMATSRHYDLVLMDCHMPEMDGFTATRAIRGWESGQAPARRVPIIALTANALPADRARCLEAGMDDHVSKPVLLPILSQALLRWLPEPTALPLQSNLDISAIDELRSMADGEPNFVAEVIALYLEDAETRVDQLRTAAATGDLTTLASIAHALRGSSANLGALEIVRICRTVEELPVTASPADCIAVVSELQLAMEQVRPQLVAFGG